jgi:hypothetical protein
VVVSRPQDFVNNIAVVGQENQSFAGFVQSPDGENTFRVVYEVNDVIFSTFVSVVQTIPMGLLNAR